MNQIKYYTHEKTEVLEITNKAEEHANRLEKEIIAVNAKYKGGF